MTKALQMIRSESFSAPQWLVEPYGAVIEGDEAVAEELAELDSIETLATTFGWAPYRYILQGTVRNPEGEDWTITYLSTLVPDS